MVMKYKGKTLTAEQESHVNTILDGNDILDITKFKNFRFFRKRFLKKLPKEAFITGNEDICWIWKGNIKDRGYGEIWWGENSYKAHRMSYIIFKGPIPQGKLIRHSCDNTSCVNPRHLIIGTDSDNLIDCVKRNRHNTAILNEEAVKVIKWFLKYKYKDGLIKKLADLHGVNKNVIQKIKSGYTWQWVSIK